MYKLLFVSFILIISFGCQKSPKTITKNDVTLVHENNIREHLKRVASEITDNSLKEFTSKEGWENVKSDRLIQFQEMISLVNMPITGKRPPLNIQYKGTIQKDGYRIEKLYYESLPNLFVPANLYIPDNIEDPVPGILYLCGHARTQKTHYQAHPRKFAEMGFVCLIVETVQWGEVYGEHWGCYSNGWFNWYSRGYTPAGVEVWNGIRGLDLLSELKQVDPDKLGITGISGGGAQSWFLAAVDPRVKAVAPVCGNSTLKAHIDTRTVDGHCDCMMPVNTYGWDFQDIGALIAPRPLLIAQADRDGLNTIESAREVFTDLKNFYDILGAPNNIEMIETPGGHSYHSSSRKKIFSFFIEHLMNKEISPDEINDIDDSPEVQLSNIDLAVYTDGIPENDRTKTIQDSFIKTPPLPAISNKKDLDEHRNRIISELKAKTFAGIPETFYPFNMKKDFRTLDGATYGNDVYSFNTEKDWRLKLDLRWRNPPDQKKPLMIVLRNPGEERWASESFISGLNDEWNIGYFETRGIGETGWAPELQWHVRRASAWTGRTIASMRIYDVLRCMEFCRTLDGIDVTKIGIAAQGEMASIAMFAALIDGDCNTLVLKDPPPTLDIVSNPNGRGPAIELLNCLQIIDLPQLPALLSPTETTFIGKIPEDYYWSIDILKKINRGESIRVIEELE